VSERGAVVSDPWIERLGRRLRDFQQTIGAFEQQVDVGRLQTQPAMLGGDKQVFHDVREPDRRFDPHDSRGAFHRVGGPHQRLDFGRIARVLFQFHKTLGEHSGVGAGLFAE
jgi:hypothetical protein